MKAKLTDLYRKLLARFGPRGWWPAETDLETVVGTVLAQNCSWSNAARAVQNLKTGPGIELDRLLRLRRKKLAELIRPSGYFNQKAERLKLLLSWLSRQNNGDWRTYLKKRPLNRAREELLELKGVGPETADSILLYGAGRKTFVIDKYTLRIGARLGLFPQDTGYHEARAFFMENLPKSAKLYNEYHALLVALGAEFCRVRPKCGDCPLLKDCPTGKEGEKAKSA